MAVIAEITLNRPSFTINDSVSPAAFNAVTLTNASVVVTGAVAEDGSTPIAGTQQFVNIAASGTLTVVGATTLAALSATTLTTSGAATLASAGVTGNLTVGGTTALTGTLGVTGHTTVTTLTSSGAIVAGNGFTVSAGTATFNASGVFHGPVTLNNTLTCGTIASGTQTVTGHVDASGNISALGTLTAGGLATVGSLKIGGGTGLTITGSPTGISLGGNIFGTSITAGTGGFICNGTTALGVTTTGALTPTTLKVGHSGHNAATALAFKTQSVGITLAVGATTQVQVAMGGSAGSMTGAIASVDYQGLDVLDVLPPNGTGTTNVAVRVKNNTGFAMSGVGVRFSVLAFTAA